MISSTMPSAKYSCSGSPDRFWNGSTAIDGLSGSGSGTLRRDAHAPSGLAHRAFENIADTPRGRPASRQPIGAWLIDTTNGAHLWADRFDGSLEDIFDLQDKVAISVAGVIEPTLRQSEIVGHRGESVGQSAQIEVIGIDADKALPLLGKAIELEPDLPAAHAVMGWCHEARYLRGGLQEETRLAALQHARQAIASGGDDAGALATAGFVIELCELLIAKLLAHENAVVAALGAASRLDITDRGVDALILSIV
jgi:hypothetical protein